MRPEWARLDLLPRVSVRPSKASREGSAYSEASPSEPRRLGAERGGRATHALQQRTPALHNQGGWGAERREAAGRSGGDPWAKPSSAVAGAGRQQGLQLRVI